MCDEKHLSGDENAEFGDEALEDVSGGVRVYFCVFDENGKKQYMSRQQGNADKYAQQHGGTVRQIMI